eukprot:GHUV01016897.1.p1 GENE.GHUV01016897.1~~GHUV01016897.1.p1  ORF type:complete len:157 (+),score=12.53 GHUV01016897.1:1397-1867(+)
MVCVDHTCTKQHHKAQCTMCLAYCRFALAVQFVCALRCCAPLFVLSSTEHPYSSTPKHAGYHTMHAYRTLKPHSSSDTYTSPERIPKHNDWGQYKPHTWGQHTPLHSLARFQALETTMVTQQLVRVHALGVCWCMMRLHCAMASCTRSSVLIVLYV